jgi:cytochrome d ubiquinol oxidase subunit II
MPAPELLLGVAVVAALVLYFLFGGADFGGGVWDLGASGPRRDEQRALIERAIGPIWEANHVWLILVVVVTFTAFPSAFAAVSIAFHVPLTLFLVGIVFRGSSFAFRSFDAGGARRRWGLGFSVASVVAPVLLGMVVGAAASGRVEIRADAAGGGVEVAGGSFAPWLAPFPIATGLLALALCAYLAATYLTNEATTAALADDFRKRALLSGVVAAALAVVTLLLAFGGAPRIAEALTGRPWAWMVEAAAAGAGVLALVALARRRYRAARVLVPAQVALVLIGWAAAQYPYLLVDDLTLTGAAADPRTLRLLVWILVGGIPVLAPSLWLLFRVFKRV